MFETLTNKANPTAASHAAKTRIMMGTGIEIMEFEFRVEIEVIVNRDSIIPSRHNKVDIKWDRNIKVPIREREKAVNKLRKVYVIIGNYECSHNLMSRNH